MVLSLEDIATWDYSLSLKHLGVISLSKYEATRIRNKKYMLSKVQLRAVTCMFRLLSWSNFKLHSDLN